jgi:hypothetical protein
MSALVALAERDAQKELWRTYVAEMAWSAARVLHGKNFPFPPFSQLCRRDGKATDARTAEEIRKDMIAQLRKDVMGNEAV